MKRFIFLVQGFLMLGWFTIDAGPKTQNCIGEVDPTTGQCYGEEVNPY